MATNLKDLKTVTENLRALGDRYAAVLRQFDRLADAAMALQQPDSGLRGLTVRDRHDGTFTFGYLGCAVRFSLHMERDGAGIAIVEDVTTRVEDPEVLDEFTFDASGTTSLDKGRSDGKCSLGNTDDAQLILLNFLERVTPRVGANLR